MGIDSLIRKVLEEVGIRKERYDLEWASATEAPLFVKLIAGFTERMKELGPIGEAEGLSREELQERLEKALDFVSNQKTRISLGNASRAVRKDAIWTIEHIDDVIYSKMSKTMDKAFA